MQQTRKTPTFNMKAVVRETGIRPDTLRAWERRYGLPNPERTEGGHRIYSQRDVDTLRWLMARQEEGLSISHAVELFLRLEAEGQDPILASGFGPAGEAVEGQLPIVSGDTIQEMRDAWLAACRTFDQQAADRILSEAFAMFPLEQVCIELLQKGMSLIGTGWYEGGTTVQQEHFASALAMQRLEALLAAMPAPSRPGKVLMGCPPDEEHTFSLMLLTVLLRRRGWDVVYLGANVPLEQLEATLAAVRPKLAIFLAQQLVSAAQLRDLADFLLDKQLPLAFGGWIFVKNPGLQDRISGHYLGDELKDGVGVVEHLLTRSEPAQRSEPLPAEYEQALAHFEAQAAALELAVVDLLAIQGHASARFASVEGNLTRDIAAALKLGDINLVSSEIQWIGELIGNRGADEALLKTYLAAYHRALEHTLDQQGQLIIDWFAALVDSF